MTAQPQPIQTFELSFCSDSEKALVELMFTEQPGLSRTFESVFDIKFTETSENLLKFVGTAASEQKAKRAFIMLASDFDRGTHISKTRIKSLGRQFSQQAAEFNTAAAANDNPAKAIKGFAPKTENQGKLLESIASSDVTFGIGAAGTGKTFIACLKAVEALKSKKVEKIFLARPAIGNGKDLGALPGDAAQKLAPYMRPLYDELNKTMNGSHHVKEAIGREQIEIAPVEFMRGRTFENAFVIVDEAQNCTVEQMKMALTRLGEGSVMVVTGDPSQCDLKDKSESGLQWALDRLEGVEGIGIVRFSSADVVRSKVVSRIIDALAKDPAPKKKTPDGFYPR